MARAEKKHTNPRTGETLTTSQWCAKIGISRDTFFRRKSIYGMRKETFEPSRQSKAPPPWAVWEDDFLKSVYPDPLWNINSIAKKLERNRESIRLRASLLGLKSSRRRTPSHNWMHIWKMSEEGLGAKSIARVLSTNHATIVYALKKMRAMTDSERLIYWETCGYT